LFRGVFFISSAKVRGGADTREREKGGGCAKIGPKGARFSRRGKKNPGNGRGPPPVKKPRHGKKTNWFVYLSGWPAQGGKKKRGAPGWEVEAKTG